MKLVTGEIMCDVDGCSSTNTYHQILEYSDGTHLCSDHAYLSKKVITCLYCHHILKDNQHGVDQNDFDGMEYRGRCTYCKYC